MTDGVLKLQGKRLLFIPQIYPTKEVADYGFRWDRDSQTWETSVSINAIRGVLTLFPATVLDSAVAEWKREYERPIEISADLHDTPAKDFQKEPIEMLIRRQRVLLALAPGLGKSFCAIVAAERIPEAKRILVVSPLSLVRNWRNEIQKWGNQKAAIWHGADREKASKWVVTNYDSVVRDLDFHKTQRFNIVIIDESVLVKNRKALRSKIVKSLCKSVPYVWLLSGSPTTRFYDDMWMQFNILDEARFSSYWRFAGRYCVLEKNQWGTAIVNNARDADIKIKRDYSDIYYARTQEQVTNLPPWIFDDIDIPMSSLQYKLYDQMEREFMALLPDGTEILAPIVLVQLVRLIQFASNPLLIGGPNDSPKWQAVSEILQFEKLPAIIWTSFKATAYAMEDLLKKSHRVAALTGDTPENIRQIVVDRFQNGDLDIIVAHPGVGKFGFTLTAARTAIYLERSYNGDDYYQSLYRIRRIGTTVSPHVIHLRSCRPDNNKNTVDHVIHRILQFRRDSAVAITSGEIRTYFAE